MMIPRIRQGMTSQETNRRDDMPVFIAVLLALGGVAAVLWIGALAYYWW